jgi:hypothetical protein
VFVSSHNMAIMKGSIASSLLLLAFLAAAVPATSLRLPWITQNNAVVSSSCQRNPSFLLPAVAITEQLRGGSTEEEADGVVEETVVEGVRFENQSSRVCTIAFELIF